jgi:RNA polymerase sigma-70 factor (ECF subfamily)
LLAPAGHDITTAMDDVALARGCAEGDRDAIAAFDRDLTPVIERAVDAVGATAAERADVCQIVRARLLVAAPGRAPRIASYQGNGSLKSWVRVVATREAARLVRRERREVAAEDDELAELLTADASPELAYLKRLYRAELAAAFREAVERLDDRARLLLRQHGLDGLSIDRLAAFHGVHRATAARWVQDARVEVLKGTRKILAERLRLHADEIDSVMRLVESRLDFSLPPALRNAS